MPILEFQDSSGGFKKRSKGSLLIILVFTILFGLLAAVGQKEKGLFIGLILTAFLFIVQYIKSIPYDKNFIYKIDLGSARLTIHYSENNDEKILEGNVNDFKLQKKYTRFSRTTLPYLAVYYNGSLKIRQFRIGDWDDKRIDEVMELFNKAVLSSTSTQ